MTENAPTTQHAPDGEPMQAGRLMKLSMNELHDGKFKRRLNEALEAVARQVHEYAEKTGDRRGAKGVLTVKLAIRPTPDVEGHTTVEYQIKRGLPEPAYSDIYKEHDGMLMVEASKQAVGARGAAGENEIDLFTLIGEHVGSVDAKTLKMIKDDDTAGRIDPSA